MSSTSSGASFDAATVAPPPQPIADAATYRARHIGWAVADGVGTITLDRPERKNPLTFDSYAELRDLFRALGAARRTVRAVVIAGAGGNFCSGGDVHEIIGPLVACQRAGDMDALLRFTRMTGDVVKAMRACPQPIIAAVDGVCAGAGAILAMASDLRIGTARSATAFLFVRVGLAGADMGACAMLPRIVGHGRASELLFTGRALGGEEALAWGFLNRLVAPEDLAAAARALAGEIAAGPGFAHAMTKTCLAQEWDMGLEAAIEAEAQAQAICMQTADFARAYHAFAARRRPVFEGD
ncbi:MAG: enoyl-CoA hydratase family protein [Rhodospirillales bacterium]|nr:enoyl-CoA hydratase family protein [Rhodospirillales bacterium]